MGLAEGQGGVGTARAFAQLAGDATLLTMGRDGSPQPGLAASWSSSSDGRVLRLVLRHGLAFHDGTAIDAPAVVRFLESSRRLSLWLPGFRDVAEIRAAGPLDVDLQLREPSSFVFDALTSLPVSGGPEGDSGAGAFRIVRSNPEPIVLEAFDRYYSGRPALDRLQVRTYPSLRAAWVALMRREIDFLYEVPSEAVEFVQATSGVQVYSSLRPYVYLLGFNVADPVLRDPAVRHALDAAIDRRHVVAQVFEGRAIPASGPLWPVRFEAPRSTSLVAPARTTSSQAPLDQPLHLSCLVPGGYEVFERLALVLQRELLNAGIDLEPEVLPVDEIETRLHSGRFQTYLLEQRAGPELHWLYVFWHSSDQPAMARSGYRGADAALDALRAAQSRRQIEEATTALQRALAQDPPAVFLAWAERSRALRRGYLIPRETRRDIFFTLGQWRVAETGSAR